MMWYDVFYYAVAYSMLCTNLFIQTHAYMSAKDTTECHRSDSRVDWILCETEKIKQISYLILWNTAIHKHRIFNSHTNRTVIASFFALHLSSHRLQRFYRFLFFLNHYCIFHTVSVSLRQLLSAFFAHSLSLSLSCCVYCRSISLTVLDCSVCCRCSAICMYR